MGVKDAFVGVTTDGTVIEDLYSIHRTGVSTRESVAAAKAWLASLTASQREAVAFPVQVSDYTQDQWRLWTNADGDRDAGLSLQDMTKAQRLKAPAILKAGMSARGLRNADKVRHLNLYGGQLVDLTDQFNDELYWLTIMGTPSATEPWGWQFEGHHLVVNYFVLGDQVVMTPTFMGTEPRVANYGVHSPVVLIELDSQDLGPIGKAAGWPTGMTQRHIHAIIRTPNGNDYGKDLLALHLALDH
ncbi:DUF3500 domain-containing protein [Streptomyces sp. NPDC127072]|uniref:DUF3500 domain-containing protein n=1 Tax=Streptomyces sp. NPDC127072 TaxID=3347129 RepID=UPI00365FCE14